MKRSCVHFKKELRDLFCSPQALFFLIGQSVIIGLTFSAGLGIIGKTGISLLAGLLPRAGTGTGALFFGDLFIAGYAWYWLFLPFIFSRMICRDREHHADLVLLQLGTPLTLFNAKVIAGGLFILVSLSVSVPAVLYWIMLGGRIEWGVLLLIYSQFLAHGIFIAGLSLLAASVSRRGAAGSLWVVAILLAGYEAANILKFIGMDHPSEWRDMLANFSRCAEGIVSVRAFTGYLVLIGIVLSLTFIRMTAAVRLRGKPVVAIICTAIIIGGSFIATDRLGFFNAQYDITAIGNRSLWRQVSSGSDAATGIIEINKTENVTVEKPAIDVPHRLQELPAPSLQDRNDIIVIYCAVLPLLLLFIAAVRLIRKSAINPGRKRMIVLAGTSIVVLGSVALVQDFYIKNFTWKVLPSVREFAPRWLGDMERLFGNNYPEKKKQGRSSIKNSALSNYIYAGDNYRNLQRFFGKLSDLAANRRDTVRIIHYGDSLIWGDCYSKTVKRRLQKEFGDGGRGIVPPVETMATALQDYCNKTPAGGFRQYAIRHEFRYQGRFYIRPELNRHYGFCGEGTYVLSPRSEIRLAVPPGFDRWNRVQVFLRSPESMSGEPDDYRVRIDYGTGSAARDIVLFPGGSGVAGFDIPPAEKITINFENLTRNFPSVDAVNVETGRGIAYSTIVRMGIHLSWMNAIPERNLKAIRAVNPDLVIFQFGINEAASLGAFPEFTEDILRSQLREWLEKIKRILPEADILLIGPPERMQVRQGVLSTMKETLAVRRIQREEAERAGLAFFDTYDSLGGEGHMAAMVNTGLAMKDYTHFTMRGGDSAAEAFAGSLLNAYQNKNGKPTRDIGREETKPILFNSTGYAYFLALVILVGFALMRRPALRLAFFVIASYYFYATWMAWPLLCLLTTTITDYGMGLLIRRSTAQGGKGTAFLVISLVVNLGILFVLKYFDFFSDLAGKSMHAFGYQVSVPILNIMMPVGISFYTFQSLSYTIDVWRRKIEPERNLIRYAQYVSMFTQLMAGPIVKAREFLPALREKAGHFSVSPEQATAALFLILSGLVKKAGADWLAGTIVDRVYASPHMFLPLETLTAVYAYGIQIYGDFSGYTDIAIGSAMLLGFNLTENFRRPYTSASVSEFWQRWHISLGSWLRDYLYISLGGNRKRVLLNIGITMFLCGLWHGAALTFIVWGLYHGLFMILERIAGINKTGPLHPAVRGVRIFVTSHIVLFGWIIFRSDSWGTFTGILNSLLRFAPGAPNVGWTLLAVLGVFYALHFTPLSWKEFLKNAWSRLPATLQGAAASAVMLILYNVSTAEVKPFIYFQF